MKHNHQPLVTLRRNIGVIGTSILLQCVVACGSFKQGTKGPHTAAQNAHDIQLADGVYPVALADGSPASSSAAVELFNVPINENTSARETIRVTSDPLVRFQAASDFEFKFENRECVEIGFRNTDTLKTFSGKHADRQIAVVVDNKVITHHEIREPLTSERIRITCCTVGGGDHLHKHLKKLARESSSERAG